MKRQRLDCQSRERQSTFDLLFILFFSFSFSLTSYRLLSCIKMVSTRRTSKRIKVQQSDPVTAKVVGVKGDVETTSGAVQDMEIDDYDDFQDSPALSVRITRSSKNKGKAPLLRSDSTQSLRSRVQRLKVAESSIASPASSSSSTERGSLRSSPSSTPLDEDAVDKDEDVLNVMNSPAAPATPMSLTEFDSGTQQVSLDEEEVDHLLQEYEEDQAQETDLEEEEEPSQSSSSSESEEEIITRRTVRRRQPATRERLPTVSRVSRKKKETLVNTRYLYLVFVVVRTYAITDLGTQ